MGGIDMHMVKRQPSHNRGGQMFPIALTDLRRAGRGGA